MNFRDNLQTAAHFRAFLWYHHNHPEAAPPEICDWTNENYVGFLGEATEELGRVLNTRAKSPADIDLMLSVMDEYADAADGGARKVREEELWQSN